MNTALATPLAPQSIHQAKNRTTNRYNASTRVRVTPFTGTPVPSHASIHAPQRALARPVEARLFEETPSKPAFEYARISIARSDVSSIPLNTFYVAANRLIKKTENIGGIAYKKEDKYFKDYVEEAIRQRIFEFIAGDIPSNFYPKNLRDLVYVALDRNQTQRFTVPRPAPEEYHGDRSAKDRPPVTLEIKITPVHGKLPQHPMPPEEQ